MLIGLSGYAGTGKDTIADILVEQHGFTRHAFADPMRDMLLALDPIVAPPRYQGGLREQIPTRLSYVIHEMGWDIAKRQIPEIRNLLQRFGTEVGRNMIADDFWIEMTMRNVLALGPVMNQPAGVHHVISDVRFENEARAVEAAGGIMCRVHREGFGPVNAHSSDSGLDDWEFEWHFHNDSTYESVEEGVDVMLTGMAFDVSAMGRLVRNTSEDVLAELGVKL